MIVSLGGRRDQKIIMSPEWRRDDLQASCTFVVGCRRPCSSREVDVLERAHTATVNARTTERSYFGPTLRHPEPRRERTCEYTSWTEATPEGSGNRNRHAFEQTTVRARHRGQQGFVVRNQRAIAEESGPIERGNGRSRRVPSRARLRSPRTPVDLPVRGGPTICVSTWIVTRDRRIDRRHPRRGGPGRRLRRVGSGLAHRRPRLDARSRGPTRRRDVSSPPRACHRDPPAALHRWEDDGLSPPQRRG